MLTNLPSNTSEASFIRSQKQEILIPHYSILFLGSCLMVIWYMDLIIPNKNFACHNISEYFIIYLNLHILIYPPC